MTEPSKLLFDLLGKHPELKDLKGSDFNKIVAIKNYCQKQGIAPAEITDILLASIDTAEDLEEIEHAGYIGINRKPRTTRRL